MKTYIAKTAAEAQGLHEGTVTEILVPLDPQPKFPFGVAKIVLVPDPWHNDAFAGTPAAGMGRTGPRELKWYCEDFAGNLVARIMLDSPYMPGDRIAVREPKPMSLQGPPLVVLCTSVEARPIEDVWVFVCQVKREAR